MGDTHRRLHAEGVKTLPGLWFQIVLGLKRGLPRTKDGCPFLVRARGRAGDLDLSPSSLDLPPTPEAAMCSHHRGVCAECGSPFCGDCS